MNADEEPKAKPFNHRGHEGTRRRTKTKATAKKRRSLRELRVPNRAQPINLKFNSGISAIILAAGMSRRMGTRKQLLKVGETTLLGQVLENVRRSRADDIVVVLGHAADDIRQHLPTDGVTVVVNPNYQEGMGSSLRTGLSA